MQRTVRPHALHEDWVHATWDGGEGNDERNPCVGYHHCLRGEIRGVTQASAGFCEGRGGGHGDRWRGGDVSRYSRGRDMLRQGRAAVRRSRQLGHRNTLNFAGDAAKAELLSATDVASFGPLIPMRDPPSLRLLRSYEARREHMDDTLATIA
eukprot:5285041-Pleurochrysis_carterae.AAC.2